ncbi:MAG: flagellar assembly protein T N-terminal domain-containing protein [SAR324 cluster bacterium]|nr:flagellar assembly protein T N-terminal domain-containing protein [SAR324 cluster bacterium]MCZ6627886.1 flagellar assembly protein T N-terminal domain-containing protein [SAR324 cluster bacterium]MCZ6842660.1 flagellar assembly protein T N-terminal domain-containing protein [SAR324 cluster bacterium]
MNPKCIILLAILLLAALAPSALAVPVEAQGQAAIFAGNVSSARKQAIVNAQRNAVEQGVGLILDSKSVLQNFQLIKDEVLTSSQGFVTKYVVLSEGRTPDNRSYRVKIKADVSKSLLQDRLSALRILHKKMGNKRVMVIYKSTNPNALPRSHGAATAAVQTLRDQLNQSGFRVFNEAATSNVYRQIEQATRTDRPVDDLIAMALDQQADIFVAVENVAGKRGTKGGMFSAAYASIRVSVYDTNTGRQIADAQTEAKQLLSARAGPYDWERGLSTAATKAAKQAADETINKIADYYKQVGDLGTAFLVVFKGFDDDEKDVILDFLENTPNFQQLSELKNTVNYMEVEIFSSENASRLRRIVRAGLKGKGLKLQIQFASRNRIVFSNPKGER